MAVDFKERERRREKALEEYTRLRERANTLLACDAFVDWAADMMEANGYFGFGLELTPYEQGRRGGIIREIEAIVEMADDGGEFLARVFRERIKSHVKGAK